MEEGASILRLLDKINAQATHWHRQMNALMPCDEEYGGLNGSFDRVLGDANKTEERLETLWMKMRREKAVLLNRRYDHWEEAEWEDEIYEELHVAPCC